MISIIINQSFGIKYRRSRITVVCVSIERLLYTKDNDLFYLILKIPSVSTFDWLVRTDWRGMY